MIRLIVFALILAVAAIAITVSFRATPAKASPVLNRPNIVQCKVIYFGAPTKRIVRT